MTLMAVFAYSEVGVAICSLLRAAADTNTLPVQTVVKMKKSYTVTWVHYFMAYSELENMNPKSTSK